MTTVGYGDMIILKRGVCMYVNNNGFKLFDIEFTKLRGYCENQIMCRLDLVKILDDERIGWVPVPQVVAASEPEVTRKEEVLNAALKRNTIKTAVDKFKQNYYEIREDVKHREIRNGWLN